MKASRLFHGFPVYSISRPQDLQVRLKMIFQRNDI